MPQTDYIGEDWYNGGNAKKPTSGTGKPPAPTPTAPPLQMDGDISGGAGVRSQGAAEQAGLDRAVAAAQQMHAAPPPGGARVYGGVGGYQYEVRGSDIYITGSKGVKLSEPRRVDPTTPRGAAAYNAIVAELNASDNLGLKPVKMPAAPAAKPETPGHKGRDTADLDAAQAAAAMPGSNAAQAAEIRRGVDESMGAIRAKNARMRDEEGAIATLYADAERP